MTVKIAHISDVHWRSLKRHDEYISVFKSLFESLREQKPDAIFVGGDIVHSKTQGISPELIENLTWWFNELGEIAETHIILGNHDGLILNESRQDAITPIIEAINNPQLNLYKKSGVYKCTLGKDQTKINWCVFSCFDEKNWNSVKPLREGINIACFHGAVMGSKTDVDWELAGEVKIDMFSGFDFGFLGDIHKLQYLDEEKRVAYPGSTIQQNYGEDIVKGYLVWEIENKNDFDSKFISIENPHPYVTIDWKGTVEATLAFCHNIKKNCRYRVRSSEDISQAEIKLLHYYLKNDKQAHEIVYQVNAIKSNTKIANTNSVLFDIRRKEDREKLINEYYDIDKEGFEKLDNLFVEMLDKVPNDLTSNYDNNWQIDYLKFDNTFSYGKNNFIDFRKLNGIIGLFGRNRAGKSSIPGTLMYNLFNTTDRGSIKNQDIVNIRKGYCESTVGITNKDGSYEITRKTLKKTNKKGITSATTDLKLISKSLSGVQIDESEEQRRETEKVLRKIIGTAEDFLYTSFASQGDINTFINEKTSARKSVLSKFLNLDIYDELYKNSREDYVVLKNMLNNTPKKDWTTLISNIDKEISQINEVIPSKKENIVKLRKQEIKLNVEKSKYDDIKKHPSGHDLESINSLIRRNEDDIIALTNKNNRLLDLNEENIAKIKKIQDFKDNFPLQDLKEQKEKLRGLQSKISLVKQEKRQSQKSLDRANKEIKILDNIPCGEEFSSCKFIKNAFEEKSNIPKIKQDIQDIENTIYEINNVISKLEEKNIESNIEKYDAVISKEYKINSETSNNKNLIEVNVQKIAILKEKLEESLKIKDEILLITNNSNSIKSLEEVENKIKDVANKIYEEERQIYNLDKRKHDLDNDIKTLEKEKTAYNSLIEKWQVYDLFSNAVSKKGLPSMLINTLLPKINEEIKTILSGATSFDVYLADDGNNLNVYIDYGDSKRIIECASGMEKMISSLAIRVALINISSLPKANVFIIDEGFGALDDTNIEACSRLLKSLKRFFKSIIIISHVDAIKDIVDKNIEISIKGQDSYVEYK
jgi:DNA repair exonuclease SbcCD ATPase subunit